MNITRQVIVLDAPDLSAESAFWAALLGGEVHADDDWHSIVVGGEFRMGIQLAPDLVPPKWPDGQPQQQLHVDLYVDDIEAAHAEALQLGARLAQDADRGTAEGFLVYLDPAGHPFCLCWG